MLIDVIPGCLATLDGAVIVSVRSMSTWRLRWAQVMRSCDPAANDAVT